MLENTLEYCCNNSPKEWEKSSIGMVENACVLLT